MLKRHALYEAGDLIKIFESHLTRTPKPDTTQPLILSKQWKWLFSEYQYSYSVKYDQMIKNSEWIAKKTEEIKVKEWMNRNTRGRKTRHSQNSKSQTTYAYKKQN